MSHKEILEEFLKVAKPRIGDQQAFDAIDRFRNDSIEELLIEKGLIDKEELDKIHGEKIKNTTEYIKSRPTLSPIQDVNLE